jgi:putative membrane protein
MQSHRTFILAAGAVILIALLIFTGMHAYDHATWLMEVLPVLVVLPILYATHRRFPLTALLYCLIFMHALVLIAGGMYTYARVPLGFYLQDWWHLSRNPYDKIGHLFQGFVPAIAAREILLRGGYLQRGKMLVFLVLSVVMAISATYELLEWASALALGQGADDFLGTQGDPWDTQSDMFCAMIGGSVALLLLSRWHDRQLHKLASEHVVHIKARTAA